MTEQQLEQIISEKRLLGIEKSLAEKTHPRQTDKEGSTLRSMEIKKGARFISKDIGSSSIRRR